MSSTPQASSVNIEPLVDIALERARLLHPAHPNRFPFRRTVAGLFQKILVHGDIDEKKDIERSLSGPGSECGAKQNLRAVLAKVAIRRAADIHLNPTTRRLALLAVASAAVMDRDAAAVVALKRLLKGKAFQTKSKTVQFSRDIRDGMLKLPKTEDGPAVDRLDEAVASVTNAALKPAKATKEIKPKAAPCIFSHSKSYHRIVYLGKSLKLLDMQAAVVALLDEARGNGGEPVEARRILGIIEKDPNGKYVPESIGHIFRGDNRVLYIGRKGFPPLLLAESRGQYKLNLPPNHPR